MIMCLIDLHSSTAVDVHKKRTCTADDAGSSEPLLTGSFQQRGMYAGSIWATTHAKQQTLAHGEQIQRSTMVNAKYKQIENITLNYSGPCVTLPFQTDISHLKPVGKKRRALINRFCSLAAAAAGLHVQQSCCCGTLHTADAFRQQSPVLHGFQM